MVFGTARAVKSHRTGRRRKKGSGKLPVAPWIVITLVCVLVAAGLTWGFVTLMRTGCSSEPYRVAIAAAPSIAGSVEDVAQEWERGQPQVGGECVGVAVNEVDAGAASRGITGVWDAKTLGDRPIAWVPDSNAWASWLASSEATASYVSSEPVVLGRSGAVLAVAESTATDLGWVGGEPPTWQDVFDEAGAGTVHLAAANPRTSTEGLVALLNATSDGAGGFSQEAMDAYRAALEAGATADSYEDLRSAYTEAADPSRVMTVLDYQVDNFNATSGAEDPLVPITPAGSAVGAVASYLVLGGADWVSDSDARIAGMFGDYLAEAVASGRFADADLDPVEDAAAALAQTAPETVGAAVRAWQSEEGQDMNVLFLLDWSSATGQETVRYGGEDLDPGTAAVRTAIATIEAMPPTWRAGLWAYGVGAGDSGIWEVVAEGAEMTDANKEALTNAFYGVWEGDRYEGGAPLYDAVVDAYEDLNANLADGAANAVVVLTNSGEDHVSAPSVEETADTLESMAGSAVVYTVGYGSANADNLALLADATGGAYIPAPDDGGLVDQIAPAT